MTKKKKYEAPKTSKEEIAAFREHSKLIDKKIKEISEMYKKWLDNDKKTWKKGFKKDDG